MNVLVLLPLAGDQRESLETAAPTATFVYASNEAVTDGQLADADVIVGNPVPRRLRATRRLRLLQLGSAGYDDVLSAGTLPDSALLACSVGAFGQTVSEHTLAMVLSLMKNLPAYRDNQRNHDWHDEGPVSTIAGARVLVLGAGDIGRHFADLVRALGAQEIVGVRRTAAPAPSFDAIRTMGDLPALLPRADVVAAFLPSSPETRGLADASFFAAMREDAYFANAGRGDLVVTDDLVSALRTHQIAGAALDVTDPEPLPADHPLWDTPGALITPHAAGWYHLSVTLDNIVRIAAENLCRLSAGRTDLLNLVER